MKAFFKIIIQTFTVVFVSWIVVYAIVYAQQGCCSTIPETCVRAFNRKPDIRTIGSHGGTLASHHRDRKLPLIGCFEGLKADIHAKTACCETDRCDRYSQTTYFRLSFVPDFHLFQKNVSASHVSDESQSAFETDRLSTAPKAIPIYILTQSIIR